MPDERLIARAAHTEAIQERARQEMQALGIDAGIISRLVDEFYARIAGHAALGPVFAQRLHSQHPDAADFNATAAAGGWDAHLAKMKSFWSAIAFKTGAYGGKPVQAHMGVEGMSPELFPQWLGLFAETLDDLELSNEAKAWFMATAERIARSLTLALFYDPARDAPG
ncbi:group III truncated hemoglobin [Allorhizobium undicola]|uniref:group III truncated hemoglobin n=1 Tax=Allorhizobium undicola TaxID=78527 RepID=UPI000481391B|nr:globin [Allorhizobium undicola]